MENQKVFSIFDRVAETFGPLTTAVNEGVAMRQFRNVIESNRLNQEEYWLFQVGEFDEKVGALIPLKKIVRIEREAALSFVPEIANE